jgi:hypothetical protein
MLCKKTLGTGDGGLMHITWLEEGPDATRKLINNTQYTVNHWLLHVSGGVGCVGVGVEVGSPKRVAADAGPGPDTPSFAACLCVRVSVRCSAGTPFNVPLLHPACLSLADTLVLPPSPPPLSPQHGMSIGIGDTVADGATMNTINAKIEQAKVEVQSIIEDLQVGG